MDISDLNSKLYLIRDNLNKDNALEMLDILEEIFEFKPINMLYFNVKARVLYELGRYQEAIDILKFKINLACLEEEYLNTCEILQITYKAIDDKTNYIQWKCMEFYINYMLKKDEYSLNKIRELQQKIINMEDNFLDNPNEDKIELELSKTYWESWYSLESAIVYAYAVKKYDLNYTESIFFKERMQFEKNYIFLFDQLINKKTTFVLVANEDNYIRIMLLAKLITILNQEVYVVMPAVSVEVDKIIDITETVNISLNNIETSEEGIIKIRPIEVIYGNKVIGNNLDLLLESITKSLKDEFALVIASGHIFNSINKKDNMNKIMQRLSEFKGDFFEKNLVFGYVGSYLSYISRIYDINVRDEINKPDECEFSIVIPVKNSSESLRYTLQTCIEQRGMRKNDYEIIVSDNSSLEYTGVKELVGEINDERIKYFRTPRELPLDKSFEYAFIKAKGKFIFSLGADDAVLPWGLETLRETLKILPNDYVVQWDRGFFVWPDNSKMSNQAGQFLIPRAYKKSNKRIERYNCLERLFLVLNNPNLMYGLPMLYINSGFRRKYLNILFKATGRLWDGGSQDVYMGVANLLINETIPYINLPITIAGMTSASIGTESNNGYNSNKDYVNKISRYYSNYVNIVPYNKELNSICVNLDISLVYSSFFRLLNVYENEKIKLIINQIDFKRVFEIIANKLNCNSLRFDYDIKSLRYSAYYNSYELGEWFDNNILIAVSKPKIIEYKNEKVYTEGFTENGGIQLDARKFNVNNIYEATKLFENICNL